MRPRARPSAVPTTAALVACGLLAPGCLLHAAKGGPPLVGDVRVEGNAALEDGEILSRIATTQSGRNWLVYKGTAYPFERETLLADARRIERLYQSHGFFSARVTETRTAERDGRVQVTFVVQEGPPAKVRTLDVEGLEALAPAARAKLLAGLPLRVGERFEEAAFEDTKALLLERLRAAGHAEAKVEAKARVDPGQAVVDVRAQAAPGPVYRVSRVFVYGAQQISRARVSDAAEVPPGSLYTPQLVSQVQRRVYDLGVFSLVQAEPGPFDRAAGTVPLILTVSEAPLQTVEVGGGVDADSTRQVARVRAGYQHRNLARGLQQLNVGGSVGYAFLPTIAAHILRSEDVNLDRGLVGDARVEYVQPRIGRSPVDASAALDYEKDLTPAFRFQRAGLRLGFPVRFPELRRLTVAPSLNFLWYFDVQKGANLTRATTPAQVANSGCGPKPDGTVAEQCRLFFGELRATWDGRDDPVTTRRGFFATAGVQLAGTPVSDFAYAGFSPEVRGYVPLGRRFVAAARGRGGALWQLGERDTPGVARFFAGGSSSLRTVGAQQLGPRLFVVQDDASSPSGYKAFPPVPVGGDRLLEASAELRWNTGWEVGIGTVWVAAFFDAARLWQSQAAQAGALQYGPGIGVRVYTPVGPARIDFAVSTRDYSARPAGLSLEIASPNPALEDVSKYRIATSCKGAAEPFCFEERWFGLHFMLGEAF